MDQAAREESTTALALQTQPQRRHRVRYWHALHQGKNGYLTHFVNEVFAWFSGTRNDFFRFWFR
jgi:hypothetical protein